MSENTSFGADAEDTEGHAKSREQAPSQKARDEQPGATDDDDNDTAGHAKSREQAPSQKSREGQPGAMDDDDDTAGHAKSR